MKKPVKPVPLGPALNTPPEELDLLALITPSDIEDAKLAASERMTARGKALTEAARAEVEPDADL